VLEHFDQFVQIWRGSPATEPMAFGTSTDEVNQQGWCPIIDIINTKNNPTSVDAVPAESYII
jgi:hypothetical protein